MKRNLFGRIAAYKEAIGVIFAVVGAIFSGVAWVISYFATQAAVSQLECRLTHQMNAASHDTQVAALQAQIDNRNSQIQLVSAQKTPSAVTLSKLLTEVKEIDGKAKIEAAKAVEELKLAVACQSAKEK